MLYQRKKTEQKEARDDDGASRPDGGTRWVGDRRKRRPRALSFKTNCIHTEKKRERREERRGEERGERQASMGRARPLIQFVTSRSFNPLAHTASGVTKFFN